VICCAAATHGKQIKTSSTDQRHAFLSELKMQVVSLHALAFF
jgi:hypothetical protein